MIKRRGAKGVRWFALVVAMALVSAACGGDSGDQELSAGDAAALMDETMGGTQSVQDFLLYLDMSVQTDDGPVSYYDEVIDRALEGAGDPVDLTGGFSFSPVDSIEGDVRDSAGEPIPSVSLDFGLLTASTETHAAGLDVFAEIAGFQDAGALPFGLGDSHPDGRGVLVEVYTADLAENRAHVGPGDVGAKDLTFVPTIAPGDDLSSVYIFGQTFPGDPADEDGLSPHELFVYRWGQGLVSIPGEEGIVDLVFDDNIVAIEGSTIVLTEPKAIAVREAKSRGTALAMRALADLEGHDFTTGPYAIVDDGIRYIVVKTSDGELKLWLVGPDGLPAAGLAEGGLDVLGLALVPLLTLDACETALRRVLDANDSMYPELDEPSLSDLGTTDGVEGRLGKNAGGYCREPFPPGAKAAGTYGDVHITTFDGWAYDNQAAGEFLVFDNGTATVQMRSAPWPGSDAVSVVTAVAVRVGDHEVAMHQDDRIGIDGEEPSIARGETIAVGDAALLWTGAAWVIVWPDGTELRMSGGQRNNLPGAESEFHPLMLLITVTGSEATGMMGSPDDDGRNDWVTRSGEQLDDDIRFDFENFYPTYIDTWRITDDESLFHYEDGETTATFTIDGFPRLQYDLADLDPDARAEAEAACADGGIERPEMLEGCILDVALTGDVGFVYDTYLAQSHTTETAAPPELEAIDSPTPADGESVVSVGSLTVRFGAEPPVVVPNFPGQWQCQAGEGTFAATSRFQETEDRQYEITVDYLDAEASRDGTERFTLVVRRNSDPIAWMQTTVDPMPGTLDSLELSGSTLTVTGTALLNDPYDSTVFPGGASFGSARIEPLNLQVTCDG